MPDVVISVENLSKQYRLGTIGSNTLRADTARWWARLRGRPDPTLRIGMEERARREGERIWALKDVSFQVKQGEVVGIIGRNGAGKSTLLKILSRITAPTTGAVKVKGRIGSLLEVGTGFHPELTGRENIFLNGAILGMKKAEIERKFDEIVDFSGVEQFIDTPVKRYSSGMYVRLAFAVAAHLEPEILLVDEVLAVGDAEFQRKCLGKMDEVAHEGRTVLFVSHNLGAIASTCGSAALFEHGCLVQFGDTHKVIDIYYVISDAPRIDSVHLSEAARTGSGRARFASVALISVDDPEIGNRSVISPGQDLDVVLTITASSKITGANVALTFFDATGYRLIDVNTAQHGQFVTLLPGETADIRFRLLNVLLKPGRYSLELWLGKAQLEEIDRVPYATTLVVRTDPAEVRHSEVFPGAYLCQFEYEIMVGSGIG